MVLLHWTEACNMHECKRKQHPWSVVSFMVKYKNSYMSCPTVNPISKCGAGVVSSSGSSGMVEKWTFSGNMLGPIWKSSGRIWGIIREIKDENGAKKPDFLEFRRFWAQNGHFPEPKHTNPEFFGNFLRWIRNAPEVKCRKIRPLVWWRHALGAPWNAGEVRVVTHHAEVNIHHAYKFDSRHKRPW